MRHAVARHVVVAVAIRVVDEKESVVAIVRMEGDAEQAALAAAQHDRADVEERCSAQPERVVDADRSCLLGDEEARVARMRERDRLIEPGGDRLQRDVLRGRRHREKHEKERDGTGHAADRMQSVRRVRLRAMNFAGRSRVAAKKVARRPDRVLFPKSGFTKNDAIDYYERVAKWMLPHLKNVPVSLKRYPDSVRGESFWEKDAPSFTPDWVRTVAVPRRSGQSKIHYIVIDDVRTLAWVADAGAIEIHPFLHRAPHIERATSVVFDLDPGEGASLKTCCEVALVLRDALGTLKLKSVAKVSGSKGLQVYVPLNGTASHDATESFARFVAEELARGNPNLITAKMGKQFRAKKIFIDWSQNADFKTTVSVYSLRAKRERPFVSMPVTWEEVEAADDLHFDPDAAVARLKKIGDLFAPVLRLKQTIPELTVPRGRETGSGTRGHHSRRHPSSEASKPERAAAVRTHEDGDGKRVVA